MTLLVPFDGSPLAKTALDRAVRFGNLLNEDKLAMTVLPNEESYTRDRIWISSDDPFDTDKIANQLEQQVRLIAPRSKVRGSLARRCRRDDCHDGHHPYKSADRE